MRIGRLIISGLVIASLCCLPALADDSQEEVDSSAEVSVVEGETGDSAQSDSGSSSEISVDLSEVTSNQKTINDNIAFLAACIISTGGLLVGYWTGKDLLDFLW